MKNEKTPKYLMILEVSQKQKYIFGSKRLRDNVERSLQVREATESSFFEREASDLYNKGENLVYTGGGHTVLQFDDRDKAKEFAKKVARAAIEKYRGIEVFVKIRDYDNEMTSGDNLNALTKALEKKKLLHKNGFCRCSIGIEELDTDNFVPVENTDDAKKSDGLDKDDPIEPTQKYSYAYEFEDIAKIGDDNFIAVVHIDGNSMGKRAARIQGEYTDWDKCRKGMYEFSKGIQKDFEDAFRETETEFIKKLKLEPGILPLRPIILAGDDVCFVTTGKYGLEAARIFLEKLKDGGRDYAACAGVAIVHTKYPFHRAYELAEKLCLNAKKFGVSLDPDGGISAMDWHIEFGQLKGSLSEIRDEYETDDGNKLELRPVTVIDHPTVQAPDYRKYDFVRNLADAMAREKKTIARSKLKDLRNAMKQGTDETKFYLKQKEISEFIRPMLGGSTEVFANITIGGKAETRCLLFDALEISDHFEIIP